ncbi:solute carrier family 25 member 35 isoform X3 [Rhinolophus sinicus]|uniref:solute carrier family 25 member 35 isoform X3 n=1 Tax=Rhinolophus sinicus TaxID=89399 RepID=UPI0009436909|nr:PREDICTED: solute carrier family 25 member 35 isoform X3 [Rhinolophus sinicus]
MDFLMSGLAACGACLFTNPLEVVKTRMQLQGELQSPGTYQRHYRNVFHAFITIAKVKTHLQAQAASEIAVGHQYKHRGMFQALTEIGQKHGLVGLWRGATGGLPRVVIGSSAQLCTFSSTKDLLTQWEIFPPQSWKGALTAAMVSGVVVVLAMTPFDVVSTRIYNQPTDVQGKGLMYRGILDALLQTARTEGIFGMYKGIGASYFRLGPHTILSLFFWDQLRILYYTYSK